MRPTRRAPFDEPLTGVGANARYWEDEREGPDEVFTVTSEIVAVEVDTAVACLEIVYGDPPQLSRSVDHHAVQRRPVSPL
jgi:hypothetical protein